LSDNPEELRMFARILLEDKELANLMGLQARKTAIEQFRWIDLYGRFRHPLRKRVTNGKKNVKRIRPFANQVPDFPEPTLLPIKSEHPEGYLTVIFGLCPGLLHCVTQTYYQNLRSSRTSPVSTGCHWHH